MCVFLTMIKLSTLEALEYFVHTSDLILKFEEKGVSDDFLNEMKKLGLFRVLNFCVKYLHSDETIMKHVKLCLEILSEYTISELGFCLSLADKISEKGKLRDIIDFAIQIKEALGTDVVCVDKENIDVTNTKTVDFYYDVGRSTDPERLIQDLRTLVSYDLSSITYALDFSADDRRGCIYVQNKKNIDSDSICVLDFCENVLDRKELDKFLSD